MNLSVSIEQQITDVLNSLLTHEISRTEAVVKLKFLFLLNIPPASLGALNASVSAIYFNDRSDYLSAHYEVVSKLSNTPSDNLTEDFIKRLFDELNPEDAPQTAN